MLKTREHCSQIISREGIGDVMNAGLAKELIEVDPVRKLVGLFFESMLKGKYYK